MGKMRLCPGCMRPLAESRNEYQDHKGEMPGREKRGMDGRRENPSRCPHCGFSLSDYRQNPRCLPVNTVLAGKYLVGKVLGEGGFGITYMGYDLNMKTRIAIKEYFPVELVSRDTTRLSEGGGSDRVISLSGEKSKTYRQGLQKYVDEARSVSRFSGTPGIVSVKDFFYENDTAYIVMEYIEGVSLKEYLKQRGGKLPEEEALAILRPVLEALEQVHGAGIVHRDISPDNIMLTFGEGDGSSGESGGSGIAPETVHGNIAAVRLIDFGAARMTAKNDQKSLTIILKHGYAPEEQYRSHGEQGPWTDVYALCAVLYRMLTGTVPEPAMDRLFSDGLKRPEELGADVSPAVSEAVMKGLAVKKENRIQTVHELSDALYAGKKAAGGNRNRKWKWFPWAAGAAAVLTAAAVFLFVGTEGGQQREPAEAALAETVPEGLEETAAAGEENPEENGPEAEGVELALDADEQEELVQTVFPRAENMIAAGSGHFLALQDDGTVKAVGDNSQGQCEVTGWDHMARVYSHRNGKTSAGLRVDGTVRVAGELEENDVASWSGITDLAVGLDHILGLKEDGSVVSAGYNADGECDVSDWTDIQRIFAFDRISLGVTGDGEVRIAGRTQGRESLMERVSAWKNVEYIEDTYFNSEVFIGVKQDGTVYVETDDPHAEEEFSYLRGLQGVEQVLYARGLAVRFRDGRVVQHRWEGTEEWDDVEWEQIAAMDGNIQGLVGLKEDGTLEVSAREWSGYGTPQELLAIGDAVMAAWGENHLAVLRRDGTVAAVGKGVGLERTYEIQDWKDVVQIDAYSTGTVGLTSDGRVLRSPYSGISYSSEQPLPDDPFVLASAIDARVAQWEDNCQVICDDLMLAALKKDGTANAMGHPTNLSATDALTGKAVNGSTEVDGWTDIVQIAASGKGTLGLKKDGTVITTGRKNTRGEYIGSMMPGTLPEWEGLTDLVSIWGYGGTGTNGVVGGAAAAIREDGSVVYLVEGNEENGQNNVSGWQDMKQLSVGRYHTVGLRNDGTVAAAGSNANGQCEVSDWKNIVSVAAGPSATIGITEDGRILMAGVFPGDFEVMKQWPAVTLPE